MSSYELYRCIREDGTSKDWAVRINPDGTVTTRWGRTGRKLINIQTRRIDPLPLKRSKAKKGYMRIGTCDIDVLGRVLSNGHSDTLSESPTNELFIRWQLALGAGIERQDLLYWRENILEVLAANDVEVTEHNLPVMDQSGMGLIHCDEVIVLLGLLLMKRHTPSGVSFTLRVQDDQVLLSDLQTSSSYLEQLGTDLASIRPLAESLGLLEPRMDLKMAILSDRHCWF